MSDSAHHLDAPTVHDPEAGSGVKHRTSNLATLPCRFAGYELLEEVARGGMGVVFRARQRDLNRIVAIKMIISGCLADDDDIQRFQAEAESAANLDHPGIVPIYEVGESEGRHFFSMAFVEGQSLAQILTAGPLDAKRAAKLVAQIADAVEYAHRQGVIHRDLKPGNVLLDEQDRPRITDFGVAKRQFSDRDITIKGELLGTPNFMPPEQAQGETDQVSSASDVYSLGALLYTALTGRPPFQPANQLDTLNQVVHDPVIAPRKLNSQIPLDLETITLKCLEKQPSRRYQQAGEVADELRAFLDDRPIRARPPGTVRIVSSWFRQHLLVASMSGVTSISLVAGLVGLAWRCQYEIQKNTVLQTALLDMQQKHESISLEETRLRSQRKQLLTNQAALQQELERAESQRLSLLAEQHAPRDLELALLLAAEASSLLPEEQASESEAGQTLEKLLRQQRPDIASLSPSGRIQLARQLAGRELTELERQRFLGEE